MYCTCFSTLTAYCYEHLINECHSTAVLAESNVCKRRCGETIGRDIEFGCGRYRTTRAECSCTDATTTITPEDTIAQPEKSFSVVSRGGRLRSGSSHWCGRCWRWNRSIWIDGTRDVTRLRMRWGHGECHLSCSHAFSRQYPFTG